MTDGQDIQFIENRTDMALVGTVVYDGTVLMYEWLPKDEAERKLRKVLGKEENTIEVDDSAL